MTPIRFGGFHRFFRSVFTKLILISLATWLLITIAVIFVLVLSRHGSEGPLFRNANLYIQYLVRDLGTPPSKENGIVLARKTGIQISYRGTADSWATSDTFPPIDEIHFRRHHEGDPFIVGRKSGHHYLKLRIDDGILLFDLSVNNSEDNWSQNIHLLLLFFLSVILLASYFAIKRVLLPLKWLNSGVEEIKDGNLSHSVPIRGNDELTVLSHSFNEMTERLSAMLKSKEILLRDISHELRSPLTRIRVALALLDDCESKADIQEDLEEMESMIAGILETARDHHLTNLQNFEKHDLVQLAAEVAAKFKTIPPGVRLLPSTLSSPSPMVSLDQRAMRTALATILDNAIKFSQADCAPVDIEVKHCEEGAKIIVTDHGCGVDEEELPFLLEPFYRVDDSRSRKTGGYGLGLSICKAIIEAHSGKIVVESVKNEGTTVTITLPHANG